MKAGIYNETVTPQNSSTKGNLITYKVYLGDNVILDGQNIRSRGFDLNDKSYIRIEGFKITGFVDGIYTPSSTINQELEIVGNDIYHVSRVGMKLHYVDSTLVKNNKIGKINYDESTDTTNYPGTGINLTYGSTNNIIEGNEIYHVDNGIFVDNAAGERLTDNTIIRHNYFHDIDAVESAHPDAIQNYTGNIQILFNVFRGDWTKGNGQAIRHQFADNITVMGNVVVGASALGLYFQDAKDIKIISNTIVHNQYSGIYLGDGITGAFVRNNILYQNDYAKAGTNIDSDYNLFYWSGTPTTLGEPNSKWIDPKFVDSENPNYLLKDIHLQPTSPAIDAGTSDGVLTTDLEGNPRYDDPNTPNTGSGTYPYYDIGAYEYQGTRNIYYVAKTGSDTNPGTEAQPWLTIQKAADTMVAGDTVYVRAGVYSERVIVRNSGIQGNLITIKNYPGETPVIDTNYSPGGFYIEGSYIHIEGFEITRITGQAIGTSNAVLNRGLEIIGNYVHDIGIPGGEAVYGIGLNYATSSLVKNNEVGRLNHDLEQGITYGGNDGLGLAWGSTNNIFEGNEVYNVDNGLWIDYQDTNNIIRYNYFHDIDAIDPAHPDAIQIYGPNNTIAYNTFKGDWTKGDGPHIGQYVKVDNLKIIGNLFIGGGNYHVRLGGENLEIINNVFYNGQYGILIYTQFNPSGIFKNNILYGDEWSTSLNQYFDADYNLFYKFEGSPNTYGQVHSKWGDPLFVDANNPNHLLKDFHLQAGSPAIDAGTSDGTPTTDLEGNLRYDDPNTPN
ncbi:MAG: right-handed parallel beta-helix repeat-containing protein, partial [bacterium]